jgi:hypothetical protein
MNKLLSRNDFREAVFARDKHTCVFCDKPAKDAHHIIERRLWPDSGYYLNNGASVCEIHHLECEMTTLSVEEVREACGILKKIIPPHLYDDVVYDKWANIVLPNGSRLKGELFADESVQKILGKGNVLPDFINHVKYPRTYHLPWSEGMTDNDRMMIDLDAYEGQRVIITEKLDGENTTMYNDHIHARSLDSRNHASRNWVKNFWSEIAHDIPNDYRICGENVFAEHSIQYDDLKTYFYGFSAWNQGLCLSWDDTLEWFGLLGIEPVSVIYDDIYNEKAIKKIWDTMDNTKQEGYVLRLADSFFLANFRQSVGKLVRKGHVQTVKHWMYGREIIQNKLGE